MACAFSKARIQHGWRHFWLLPLVRLPRPCFGLNWHRLANPFHLDRCLIQAGTNRRPWLCSGRRLSGPAFSPSVLPLLDSSSPVVDFAAGLSADLAAVPAILSSFFSWPAEFSGILRLFDNRRRLPTHSPDMPIQGLIYGRPCCPTFWQSWAHAFRGYRFRALSKPVRAAQHHCHFPRALPRTAETDSVAGCSTSGTGCSTGSGIACPAGCGMSFARAFVGTSAATSSIPLPVPRRSGFRCGILNFIFRCRLRCRNFPAAISRSSAGPCAWAACGAPIPAFRFRESTPSA